MILRKLILGNRDLTGKLMLFLSLLALFNSITPSFASHIMGGELCYTFLGYNPSNGYLRYQIQACMYRDPGGIDCPDAFDLTIEVREDVPGYPVVVTSGVSKQSVFVSAPPLPPTCNFSWEKPSVERCCYTATIEIPPSINGYHIVVSEFLGYTTCCRPGDIDNIVSPGSQGFIFYNYIPPTFYENSSPCFVQPATPWLCAGDTISFPNGAVEPDGDNLFFKLDTPWTDVSTFSLPFPRIQYNPGYDATQPFGPLGLAQMNGATGNTLLFSPNPGQYVVAVDIKEYRNGVLMSNTRRDYEVLVDACPPQDPPTITIDTTQNTDVIGVFSNLTQITYVGDTLCFPIVAFDPEGDSVILRVWPSPIFNPNLYSPPATLDPGPQPINTYSEYYSGDTVRVNFCWVPCRGTDRPTPYTFDVSVRDYSCPSKENSFTFAIFVYPFEFPPDSIIGKDTVCTNSTSIYTIADTTLVYTHFEWSVTGGTILGSDSDRIVKIQWGNTMGWGLVQVIKHSGPCRSDTLYKYVWIDTIGEFDVVVEPFELDVCPGETDTFVAFYDPTWTYSWTPTTGVIGPTDSNVLVVAPQTTTKYTVTAISGGCRGSFTVTAYARPNPNLKVVPANPIICQGDTIALRASGAKYYKWEPYYRIDYNDRPRINAYPNQTTTYTVYGETEYGCKDSLDVTIMVYGYPDIEAGPDVNIAPGMTIPLDVQLISGTYTSVSWEPETGLDDPTTLTPNASPVSTTTYVVKACNSEAQCCDYDTITVYVTAPVHVPTAFTPNGDGVNDILYIYGYGFDELNFKIIDRWGQVVFETTDPSIGWDGTYQGKPQPPGTYAYIAKGRMQNGETFVLKGSITLIR